MAFRSHIVMCAKQRSVKRLQTKTPPEQTVSELLADWGPTLLRKMNLLE